MSHASFEVAAAKSNLRTLDNPPTRQMEESMEDTMTIEMTESQQSMIRFNQECGRSNLQAVTEYLDFSPPRQRKKQCDQLFNEMCDYKDWDDIYDESTRVARGVYDFNPCRNCTQSKSYQGQNASQNHSRSHSPDHDFDTSDEPIAYFPGQQQKGPFSLTDGRAYGYHTFFNPHGIFAKKPSAFVTPVTSLPRGSTLMTPNWVHMQPPVFVPFFEKAQGAIVLSQVHESGVIPAARSIAAVSGHPVYEQNHCVPTGMFAAPGGPGSIPIYDHDYWPQPLPQHRLRPRVSQPRSLQPRVTSSMPQEEHAPLTVTAAEQLARDTAAAHHSLNSLTM